MSVLSLGNISINWSNQVDKFYIAGLVESESGLIDSKILRSRQEIESFYGDFKYINQYKALIDKDIPVILIPTLTKESPFNKCSLRLVRAGSDNIVRYCHPKIDKQYTSISLGNVVVDTPNGEGIVHTKVKFYPQVRVIKNENDLISCKVFYKYNEDGYVDIKIKTTEANVNELKVIYELIPKLDSVIRTSIDKFNPNNYGIFTLIGVNRISNSDNIKLNSTYLPEVVLTQQSIDELGWDELTLVKVSKNENNLLNITPGLISDRLHRLDIRYIPDSLLNTIIGIDVVSDLINKIAVSHDRPKYRNIKLEYIDKDKDTHEEVYADINYINNNLAEVTLTGMIKDALVKFNIISDSESINIDKIERGIDSYNAILDLSKVSDEYLMEVSKVSIPNFILLDSIKGIICLSTIEKVSDLGTLITSSPYDEFINYQVTPWNALDLSLSNIRYSYVSSVYSTLNNLYSDSVKILMDIIKSYITSWIKHELELHDKAENQGLIQYKVELESDTAFNRLINNSYIEDYWLSTNYYIDKYIHKIIEGNSEVIDQLELFYKGELVYKGKEAWNTYCELGLTSYDGYELMWNTNLMNDEWITRFINPFKLPHNGVNLYGITAWNTYWNNYKEYNIDLESYLYHSVTDSFQLSKIYNIPIDKLFLTYINPTITPYFYKFDNLDITEDINYTQDRLCEYSNDDKLIEFYAIPKGPVGKNISVNITKSDIEAGIYNIEITNGEITESYQVYLVNPLNEVTGVIQFDEINNYSQLVKVRSYTYRLSNGILTNYNDLDIDEYREENDLANYINYLPNNFDTLSKNDKDNAIIQAKLAAMNYLALPQGSWKLDRVTKETYTLNDLKNTIKQFSHLDFYPDLIIIDETPTNLIGYDWRNFQSILYDICRADSNYADDITLGLYTQVLINLHNKDLVTNKDTGTQWFNQYGVTYEYNKDNDNHNRFIYFYGDIFIDELLYSCCYPYILDIINSSYLKELTENIYFDPFSFITGNTIIVNKDKISEFISSKSEVFNIHDRYSKYLQLNKPESELIDLGEIIDEDTYPIKIKLNGEDFVGYDLKEYLNQNKINFLKYDNLKYFYYTLYEPKNQTSIFIVRFLTSKVSRELLKIKHDLVGLDQNKVTDIINNLVANIRNLSELYNKIDYEATFNGNYMKLAINVEIKSLVNKKFKLDFELNVN